MKDSQDWLAKILIELVWNLTDYKLEDLEEQFSTTKLAEAKSAIRKHILQEALEMIDTPNDMVITKDYPIFLSAMEYSDHNVKVRNQLRQELRNKFNDKYKED